MRFWLGDIQPIIKTGQEAESDELDYLPNTETMWAELRRGARAERSAYSLPEIDKIPNWKPLLAAVQWDRQITIPARNRRIKEASLLAGLFTIISILLIWILWSKRRRIPSKLTKQHPLHVSMGAV